MQQTYSVEFESLFRLKGGRNGKKNKSISSRDGKYSEIKKYSDKLSKRQKINTPKKLTKSYLHLTWELNAIQNKQ